jgi:DNA-binding response OmpR family regulator
LVVDDDPQVLKLLGRILENGGYSVHLMASGKMVTEVLRAEVIDLLILDLNMPEPDGFELLKTLRIAMPGLRILVISGFLEGALLKAAELLGATATLAKSDSPEMLLSTVNGLLRQRQRDRNPSAD